MCGGVCVLDNLGGFKMDISMRHVWPRLSTSDTVVCVHTLACLIASGTCSSPLGGCGGGSASVVCR